MLNLVSLPMIRRTAMHLLSRQKIFDSPLDQHRIGRRVKRVP